MGLFVLQYIAQVDVLLSRAETLTHRFSINYLCIILEWSSDWRSLHLFDGVDKRAQLAQPADHSRGDPRGCFDIVGQVELQATRCLVFFVWVRTKKYVD